MAWLDNNYLYRKKITIESGEVSADETNFPSYYYQVSTDFQKALANGFDFKVSVGEDTEIAYERIKWDDSTGELFLAILTNPLAASDVQYYIYYGYSGETVDQQDAAAVWDADYMMVQQCNEASGNIIDSTSNNNDSDVVDGSPTYGAAGLLGDAIDFPGSAAFEIPDDATLDLTTSFTIQFLIKTTDTGSFPTVIGKGAAPETWLCFIWSGVGPPNGVQFGMTTRHTNGGQTSRVSDTVVNTDAWILCTGRWDGTNLQMWLDGVQDGTIAESTTMGTNTNKVTIGAYDTEQTFPYEGLLQLLQVSDIGRSDDWILTSSNNIHNNATYWTTGAEENRPTQVVQINNSGLII